MMSELNRGGSLPIRTPGAATDERPSPSAPAPRLTCPSCSAELTSMVDHAIAPAQDSKGSPLTWTNEAAVVAATLKALRASAAMTPGVEALTRGEDTSSSPQTPNLRLVPPLPQAVTAVETAPGDSTSATADDAPVAIPQTLSTRRRRQGFFSRVLTVRTFRVERDVAKGARDHDAAVTALLDGAASDVLSLHHHRLPGRRADVAHVSVGASGVFVIDARHLKPAPRDLAPGGDGEPGANGPEDRAADAIATVRGQVAAVRSALDAAELHDVRVQGLVCPGGKNLGAPRPGGGEASEVRVISRDDLTSLVTVAGPLTDDDRVTLIELLKTQLTPSR